MKDICRNEEICNEDNTTKDILSRHSDREANENEKNCNFISSNIDSIEEEDNTKDVLAEALALND